MLVFIFISYINMDKTYLFFILIIVGFIYYVNKNIDPIYSWDEFIINYSFLFLFGI